LDSSVKIGAMNDKPKLIWAISCGGCVCMPLFSFFYWLGLGWIGINDTLAVILAPILGAASCWAVIKFGDWSIK
jgi:hypothetical protein